jgi:hypothetical protein
MLNSVLGKQTNDSFTSNVNQLNTFFATLGETTVADLPKSDYSNYMKNVKSNSHTFVLTETNQVEVLLTGLSLANKWSCGFDEISPAFLKSILHLILIPLTHIFNLSFRIGIVPIKLKLAKVVPIYKSGDKTQSINYRPISLLPTFSKILEKLMYKRLICFIEKFKLLSNCQYGFREKRNTQDAVYNLTNYITEMLDKGLDVMGLFIDVSKAFDSLSHHILLDKLYSYGFRGTAYLWFSSYLSERYQYVNINNSASSLKLNAYGIPQGSILGPILFLLYINDLPNVSNIVRFILFADDTTCLIPCCRNNNNTLLFNNECNLISCWFQFNRLVLNLKKCKCVYFSLCNHNSLNIPDILLNNHAIECVNSVKFLGCYVDHRMDWHDHINYVSMCLSKGIAMIRFIHYFPPFIKKVIIFCLLVSVYNILPPCLGR